MAPRRRVVRQQSLASRVTSLPFDLWLAASERVLTVDWDLLGESYAVPIGASLNLLLWLCRIYWYFTLERLRRSGSLFETDYGDVLSAGVLDDAPRRTSPVALLVSTVAFVTSSVSIVNAVYSITRTRHYTLMGRALDNAPGTPSARKVLYRDSDEEDEPVSLSKQFVSLILSAISGILHGSPRPLNSSSGSPSDDELWSIDMWDPPLFNVYLLSTFSPLHVFVLWFCPVGWFQIMLLLLLSGFLYSMSRLFLVLVKDKSVVHSEVLSEYGKKVVHPLIAVKRRDVSVSTDDDVVEVFSPAQGGNFVQHDVRASRSRTSMAPTRLTNWTPTTPVRGSRLRNTYVSSPLARHSLT